MATEFDLEFQYNNQRFSNAAKGLEALGENLGGAIDRAGPVLARELRDLLTYIASEAATRHGNAWPGGTGPKTLSTRSGALVRSILDGVWVEGDHLGDIQGGISTVSYGATQEFGATIRPKNGKYLAIPLPAALDARGVPLKLGPRQWDNTFVATSKNGNLIIFQRRGATIIPLYVLKTEVTIPPRLGLRDSVEIMLPFFVDRAIAAIHAEMTSA